MKRSAPILLAVSLAMLTGYVSHVLTKRRIKPETQMVVLRESALGYDIISDPKDTLKGLFRDEPSRSLWDFGYPLMPFKPSDSIKITGV